MLPFLRTVADDTVFWAGCANQFCMRRQEVARAAPAPLFQGWRLRRGAVRLVHPRVRLILCKSAISNSAAAAAKINFVYGNLENTRAHSPPCLFTAFLLAGKSFSKSSTKTTLSGSNANARGRALACVWANVFWLRGQNVNTNGGCFAFRLVTLARSLGCCVLFHLCMCCCLPCALFTLVRMTNHTFANTIQLISSRGILHKKLPSIEYISDNIYGMELCLPLHLRKIPSLAHGIDISNVTVK